MNTFLTPVIVANGGRLAPPSPAIPVIPSQTLHCASLPQFVLASSLYSIPVREVRRNRYEVVPLSWGVFEGDLVFLLNSDPVPLAFIVRFECRDDDNRVLLTMNFHEAAGILDKESGLGPFLKALDTGAQPLQLVFDSDGDLTHVARSSAVRLVSLERDNNGALLAPPEVSEPGLLKLRAVMAEKKRFSMTITPSDPMDGPSSEPLGVHLKAAASECSEALHQLAKASLSLTMPPDLWLPVLSDLFKTETLQNFRSTIPLDVGEYLSGIAEANCLDYHQLAARFYKLSPEFMLFVAFGKLRVAYVPARSDWVSAFRNVVDFRRRYPTPLDSVDVVLSYHLAEENGIVNERLMAFEAKHRDDRVGRVVFTIDHFGFIIDVDAEVLP